MKYFKYILAVSLLISSTMASTYDGKCGPGYGKCANGNCCSKFGWCGKTEAHCLVSNGCQSEFGICTGISKTSVPKTTTTTTKRKTTTTTTKRKSTTTTTTKRKSTTTTTTKRKSTTTTKSKSTSSTAYPVKSNNPYGIIDQESKQYAQDIWNYLVKKIGNEYGAAGMMGNIYAESRLIPNNLEDYYEITLGMTDEEYTRKVDNGKYKDFIYDSAGYGLVQWTYYTRKGCLLKYAIDHKKSISDLNMQLDYFWKEMTQDPTYYNKVLSVLKKAKSVQEASDVVVLEYERPVDHGQNELNKRAKFGKMLLYALGTIKFK